MSGKRGPGSAVALMAHPDDAEICLGGTLARLVDAGWEAHIVIASIPNLGALRRQESLAGAAHLGATVHFTDDALEWRVEDLPVHRLVGRFDRVVDEVAPRLVFTHWSGDTHRDHVLVAQAALSAARDHHCDVFMCDQANHHAPFGSPFPADTFVDMSEQFGRKLEAVKLHASQAHTRDHHQHLEARARYYGERFGVRYAEAFHCVQQRLEF